jgi:uncharacterized protein YecE (DUF72 family)
VGDLLKSKKLLKEKSIKIGNCGWSYLNADAYFPEWERHFKSKLQAYAKLFDLVEINSTFYAIPKVSTAKKWRDEVNEIKKDFEFTIKVSHLVTHKKPFSDYAFSAYEKMKEIAHALQAKILVFQSPASFKPTEANINKAKKFFEKVDRDDLIFVWEVRWAKEWNESVVKKVFAEIGVNQCVDPLRQACFYAKDIVYYRLHGFGRPSMYHYKFSESELRKVSEIIKKERKDVYVLFNNAYCYEDALQFAKITSLSKQNFISRLNSEIKI